MDITLLLSNLINHPVPEMHDLFARLLYHTLFGLSYEADTLGTADAGMTEAAK